MKLQNNQSVIEMNGFQRNGVGINPAAEKAKANMYGVAAKGFSIAMDKYVESEHQDEAERVMQADNEITKRLGELQLNINENMQGSKAANAQSYFEQEAQRIKDEVYSKSGIKYQIGQDAFNKNAENNIINGSVSMAKWQSGQLEAARITTFNTFEDNKLGDVLSGAPLQNTLKDVESGLELMFANKPPEVLAKAKQSLADKWAVALAAKAISEDDFGSVENYLNFFGGKVSAATKSKIAANLQANREYSDINKTAKSLMEKGVTSYEDIAEALEGTEAAKGKYKLNSGVSLKGAKDYTKSGLEAVTATYNGLSDDEIYVTSVNDSNDIHAGSKGIKGSHANGDKADVASDRLANDAEFRQQYISKLESMGIHVINEYDNPSENSTGGHLDLDFSDYKSKPQVSQQKIDKIYAKVQQLGAIKKHDEEAAVNAQYDSCYEELWQAKQSGINDPAEFERIIGKYAGQSKDLDAKLGKLSTAFGSSSAGTAAKLDPITKETLARSIKYYNRFNDKEALIKYMDDEGILNVDDRAALLKAQQEGLRTGYKEAISLGVSDASLSLDKDEQSSYKSYIKPHVERIVERDIEEYKAKNGTYPSVSDVTEFAKKAATKTQIEVAGGWFGFGGVKVDVSPAQLETIGIAEVNKLPNGNIEVVKYTRDFENATGRTDGAPTKSFEMTPDDFQSTVGVLIR